MEKTINELEEYINIYTQKGKNTLKDKPLFPECVVLKKDFVGNVFSDYHHHALYEILYVKNGKVKYSIENQKYILNTGDVIFISPSKLHRLDSIESTSCERIVLNFTEDFINRMSTNKTDLLFLFKEIDKTKNYKLKVPLNNMKKINKLLDIMQVMQFNDTYGTDIIYSTVFAQLMILFNSIYENTEEYDEPIISNPIVNKINDFIMDNLSQKLLLDNIAKHVNLSTSRIQHIFKEETGISLNLYIIKKKLQKATELLRDNKKSIDIYEDCGFLNYTSFLRAFKNEYGVTPKEYLQLYLSLIHISEPTRPY